MIAAKKLIAGHIKLTVAQIIPLNFPTNRQDKIPQVPLPRSADNYQTSFLICQEYTLSKFFNFLLILQKIYFFHQCKGLDV